MLQGAVWGWVYLSGLVQFDRELRVNIAVAMQDPKHNEGVSVVAEEDDIGFAWEAANIRPKLRPRAA